MAPSSALWRWIRRLRAPVLAALWYWYTRRTQRLLVDQGGGCDRAKGPRAGAENANAATEDATGRKFAGGRGKRERSDGGRGDGGCCDGARRAGSGGEQLTKAEKKRLAKGREEGQEEKRCRARSVAEALLSRLEARLSQAVARGPATGGDGAKGPAAFVVASVDVEAYERDTSLITKSDSHSSRLGRRRQRPARPDRVRPDSPPPPHHRGEHGAAQRHFLRGQPRRLPLRNSELLPQARAVEAVAEEHGGEPRRRTAVKGDLAWLRSIGVAVKGGEVVDADACGRARSARRQSRWRRRSAGLKALAQAHGLAPAALHNGANDAAFTLQLMLSQCGVAFDPPPRAVEAPPGFPVPGGAGGRGRPRRRRGGGAGRGGPGARGRGRAFASALEEGVAMVGPETGVEKRSRPR